jgi:periplasmic protein TonB
MIMGEMEEELFDIEVNRANEESASKEDISIRADSGQPDDPTYIVSQVDVIPKLLNLPMPYLTDLAIQNKTQGTVTAKILVGTEGKVTRFEVITGLPDGLNEEAAKAAYKMQFVPARKNEEPVSCWLTVNIDFKIK